MATGNLKIKALGGFLNLMIIMGLLMFLPAWTFNYWQGWLYWSVFSLSCLSVTLYFLKKDPKLIERRLNAGPAAEKEKTQKIIRAAAGIFFLAMINLPGFDHRYHWSSAPDYVVVTANIFVALSMWIIYRIFKENSFASSIIEVGGGQKVISTGPYSIMRHPMYSGGILLCFFSPLAMGSYVSLIFAAGVIAVIIVRLLDEEKFLSKNLEGYSNYCRKVRYRIIPLVW